MDMPVSAPTVSIDFAPAPEVGSTKPVTDAPLIAKPDRSSIWIAAAVLVALFLKLYLASSTFGTNDVVSFYDFGRSLTQDGLERTYAKSHLAPTPTDEGLLWTHSPTTAFNHPPLVAYYLRLIYRLDHLPVFEANNISFPLLLRLPGILADAVVVLVLARWRKRLRLPLWSLVALALSPAALMVSGFHGNTDPVMVMFLVLAASMCLRRAPVWCGLLLAISCQIKIIPLVTLPIFAFFWFARGKTLRFGLPFAAASILLCIEPLLSFPALLFRNVLSYGGFAGSWGITYLHRLAGPAFGAGADTGSLAIQAITVTGLKIVVVTCVVTLAWRRRKLAADGLFQSLALAWLIFFSFSPAAAPQYMVWLIPFVLVLSPAIAACLVASTSVFLFVFYNTTAKGLPWHIAISTEATDAAVTPWTVLPWLVCIGALVVLSMRTLRRTPRARQSIA